MFDFDLQSQINYETDKNKLNTLKSDFTKYIALQQKLSILIDRIITSEDNTDDLLTNALDKLSTTVDDIENDISHLTEAYTDTEKITLNVDNKNFTFYVRNTLKYNGNVIYTLYSNYYEVTSVDETTENMYNKFLSCNKDLRDGYLRADPQIQSIIKELLEEMKSKQE